tara:strand:- start:3347 stop:4300 length:954 start_codon:yes stop_codon:yes gene_type:complete
MKILIPNYLSFVLTISSFLITFLSYKFYIPFIAKYIIDIPIIRSSHKFPKPTTGGLVFATISSLLSLYFVGYKFLIFLPLAIIGFLDDILNISSKIRYCFQFLSVIFLISIMDINFSFLEKQSFLFSSLLIILIVIGSTGLINFINFMDGIDGLLAGVMIPVLLIGSIYVSNIYFLTLGPLLAFLNFNWSPSKIFMGDVGSMFLGLIYISILVNAEDIQLSIALILIAGPLFLDAMTCLIARYKSGQNIFEAHKLHLYQRLVLKGWSHSKVSSIYIFSSTILALIYYLFGFKSLVFGFLSIFIAGTFINKKFASPFP